MKTQHTPGPWQAQAWGDGIISVESVCPGLSTTVATLTDIKEKIANARLIAAAPELLEALKAMVWTFEKLGDGIAIVYARAIIAKVKGN